MDVGKKELEHGGTVCPECGKRQAHTHLGWLELMGFAKERGKLNKKSGGILFTALHCDKCGTDTLMVRFEDGASKDRWTDIQRVIWAVFGKELPKGGGCISI